MNIEPEWFQEKVRELEKKQFLIGPSVENTGVSAAWVVNGKVAGYGTAGFRDREERSPVTANTVFPVASITKSFTATLAAQTHLEHGISLEEPIKKYLKHLRFPTENIARNANVIDLLAHRMGMARHDALWFYQEYEPEEIYEKLEKLDFNPTDGSGFRNSFQYNNIFYALAGSVTEKISGKKWADEIHARYFKPLGMSSSYAEFSEVPAGTEVAQPYFRELRTDFFKRWTVAPAASIFSTPLDLTRWLMFQMSEAPEALTQVWNDLGDIPENGNCFEVNQYGLGWFIDTLQGRKLIHHAGSINGTSTMAAFMPEEKAGVVVFVNQVQSKLAKFLSHAVLSHLLDLPEGYEEKFKPKPLYSAETLMPIYGSKELDAKNPFLSAKPSVAVPSEWLGTFTSDSYGELHISESTEGLKFTFGKYDFPAKVLDGASAVLLSNSIGMPASLKVRFENGVWRIPFNLHPGCLPINFSKSG